MSHTLLTFLGRGREKPGIGYRTTTYCFPDGSKSEESAFFGLELARYLDPDTVVVFGTCGSQWSVLVEHLAGKNQDDEPARLELMYAEVNQRVTQAMLNSTVHLMTRGAARTVISRLIPFGRDQKQKYEILESLAASVCEGDDISFDVTHGFRHLGMVGFLSSFMLEQIKRLKVKDLWYGALDMTVDDVTPVLRLDGLVRVRRWVDALARFDATGDYGVFARLLEEDGVPPTKARCLEAAAFYERNCNLPDAKTKLQAFLPVLNDPLQGASELFRKRLRQRLSWVGGKGMIDYQRALADQYLERGDYMRATVFGWECLVWQVCERFHCDPQDFDRDSSVGRHAALKRARKDWDKTSRVSSWKLKRIRDSLAHGTPPKNRRTAELLKNQTALPVALKESFSRLLR